MPDRAIEITTFLAEAGWAEAKRSSLAGDASRRRYLRLERTDGARAVLMDAPPSLCGYQDAFLTIGAHLRSLGLAAPEVFFANIPVGLILMEDLGACLFAQEARKSANAENTVYNAAVDVLIHLNRPVSLDLEQVTPERLTEMVQVAFTHYAGPHAGAVEIGRFNIAFCKALEQAMTDHPVLVLRDYHGENLVWRADLAGLQRAGLLDFQDALIGPAVYDLVSLLQDARRDLQPGLEARLMRRYLAATGADEDAFLLAYHTVAVQRHLRILGVFSRLSLEENRQQYLDYIPRTWNHLQSALRHPALKQIAVKLERLLPPPTHDVMARLRGGRFV